MTQETFEKAGRLLILFIGTAFAFLIIGFLSTTLYSSSIRNEYDKAKTKEALLENKKTDLEIDKLRKELEKL